MTDSPKWERGFRCHGYWIGVKHVGWVRLPCRPGRCSVEGYGWGVVNRTGGYIEGTVFTLREAKRKVEAVYKEVCGARD